MRKILTFGVIAIGIALALAPRMRADTRLVYQAVGVYKADDGYPELVGTEKWAWVSVEVPPPVVEAISYSFEKRYAADGTYSIWYVSKGCTKKVDENKPLYVDYVVKGYEVKAITYVAPTVFIDALREAAKTKAEIVKRNEYAVELWEKSKQKTDLDSMKIQIDGMNEAQLKDYLK